MTPEVRTGQGKGSEGANPRRQARGSSALGEVENKVQKNISPDAGEVARRGAVGAARKSVGIGRGECWLWKKSQDYRRYQKKGLWRNGENSEGKGSRCTFCPGLGKGRRYGQDDRCNLSWALEAAGG